MFQGILLHAIMDTSAKGGLKSKGNTMTVQKNPPKNREQLQKFPLNLKFFLSNCALNSDLQYLYKNKKAQ